MKSYQYHVVIKIEEQILICQIIRIVSRALLFECRQTVIINKDNQIDTVQAVNALLVTIYQHLPGSKRHHFLFEVYIPKKQTQQRLLQLPSLRLSGNEKTWFVQSSIYNLFELPISEVFFDYAPHFLNKQKLCVMICKKNAINLWLNVFSKLQLDVRFIGLAADYKLPMDPSSASFNFLPWRLALQTKQKQCLLISLMSYMSITLLIMGYFWWQMSAELSIYQQQVAERQRIHQQLVHQVTKSHPHFSAAQLQLTQFLVMLSQQSYPNILLDSVDFSSQQLTLTGKSLSYLDITHFAEFFRQQLQIETAQITSVSMNQNKLTFQMEIKLHEP